MPDIIPVVFTPTSNTPSVTPFCKLRVNHETSFESLQFIVLPKAAKIKTERVSFKACPCTALKTIEPGWARRSSAERVEALIFKIPQTAIRTNNWTDFIDLKDKLTFFNPICI